MYVISQFNSLYFYTEPPSLLGLSKLVGTWFVFTFKGLKAHWSSHFPWLSAPPPTHTHLFRAKEKKTVIKVGDTYSVTLADRSLV